MQKDRELVVTPKRVLRAGKRFTVDVRYAGTTGQPEDNTGALYGWVSFADGAFVANEPDGASTWFPVNDSPYDKASYDFRITVPRGTVAVANGDLLGSRSRKGWTTYRWSADEPMASYLAMAASGDYQLSKSRTPSGLPIINAVDTDLSAEQQADVQATLALQPEMIAYFSRLFGPYPFSSFGAVVDDDEDAGYALENQTRPIYSGPPSEGTVAHELAHQWYGDSVTAEALAGHLAQRGVRHLRGVAVDRPPRWGLRLGAVRRRLRASGIGGVLAAGDRRPGGLGACSTAPSTTGAR